MERRAELELFKQQTIKVRGLEDHPYTTSSVLIGATLGSLFGLGGAFIGALSAGAAGEYFNRKHLKRERLTLQQMESRLASSENT